jgi:photoactive yellow protein
MDPVFMDDPALPLRFERLSKSQLDELPFGVVRLTADGVVEFYSRREGELSGYAGRPVLGRPFFDSVAPCMNTDSFRGRIEAEQRTGRFDFEFGHTGDFEDPTRILRCRVFSAADGGYWLLMARPEKQARGGHGPK